MHQEELPLPLPARATLEQCEWLTEKFGALTTAIDMRLPSEWAEQTRRLPEAATPLPGYYRFDVTPFLREILDTMSVDHPVREVAVMKGVQIGATTGLGENFLGYLIEEVKTAPVMWVTGNADMMRRRLNTSIIPMFIHSDLERLIRSSDIRNTRKTGRTEKLTEWRGGGCLIPLGAQNPAQFRQQPALAVIADEVDSWPLTTANDGDPINLVRSRTKAYGPVRKILWLSSPTLTGQSQIAELFQQGDQRRYFVRCLDCGEAQTLKWSRTNHETGEKTGMVWEMDGDRLVPGTVRYLCCACGYPHTNEDKSKLLSPDYGAEWRPTAKAVTDDVRSYHIPALLSPPQMQSWESLVVEYLGAWDVERNVMRDGNKFQVFYNNVLGDTYELRGSGLKLEEVSPHRRDVYRYGEIPNDWAKQHCGGPVLFLTCTVDVHKDNLAVAVFGWTRGRRAILVDYWRFESDTEEGTERLDDPGTWGRLAKFLESKVYEAEGRRTYSPVITLIDSGYHAPQVYDFCAQYDAAIYPIKGVDTPPKNARYREFSQFETPHGQVAFNVHVDGYKSRLIGLLRHEWDGQSLQPDGHFNAPRDATDLQLKELTRERKRPRTEAKTGKRIGWEWYRTAGSANELWDLLVYASCAVDIVAWDVCQNHLGLEETDWDQFWHYCEAN